MRNFYKVLGIAASADDLRIKSAFRRRAKAVHPDLNPGSRRAEARFIELVQAYEVLRHAETRAEYDAHLAERCREARRRFAHCAGLMAASFVVTIASGLLAVGLSGAQIPLRQSWEVAAARLSSTSVPAPAAKPTVKPIIKPTGTDWTAEVAVAAAPLPAPDASPITVRPAEPERGAAAALRSWEAGTRTHRLQRKALAPRRVAAAPARRPRTAPADSSRSEAASQKDWWSWLTAPPPERRYSLGASDVRP